MYPQRLRIRCATASIKKPIHNVKEAGKSRSTGPKTGFRVFISGAVLGTGGAYRDRTDDLMLAKQPLSQLS